METQSDVKQRLNDVCLQIAVAQLASKSIEQGAFARAWGPQQEGHAPRGDTATQAIQDGELALICFHQPHTL